MKSSETRLVPIEGGSRPFWVIPEDAVEYLEKTSTAILQACQNVVSKGKEQVLTSLVNEAQAISNDGVGQRWDAHVPVRWEYLAELEFVMLSAIQARMKTHLGFIGAAHINALPKDVAIEKGLTPDLVKEALEESVPCANTFTELANLIRGLNCEPEVKLTPVERDAICAKIMVSVNRLRPEIERVVGPQQVAEFCDEAKNTFGGFGSANLIDRRQRGPLFGLGSFTAITEMIGSLVESAAPKNFLSRLSPSHIQKSLIKRLEQWQSKKVIEIMAKNFSDSKSFKLLEKIIAGDIQRNGVEVKKADIKSLKDLLRKHGHTDVIKSLKYKKGKLRTAIPPGQIAIIPRRSKK